MAPGIDETFYLSDPDNISRALELTGLAPDELEAVVGRFKPDHGRFPGLLKGEVVVYLNGNIVIRHHFTKKRLWSRLGGQDPSYAPDEL